jgi:hypothetical protein
MGPSQRLERIRELWREMHELPSHERPCARGGGRPSADYLALERQIRAETDLYKKEHHHDE